MKTYINIENWKVEVDVLGSRKTFGRSEVEVVPKHGSGEPRWVLKERIIELDMSKIIKPK